MLPRHRYARRSTQHIRVEIVLIEFVVVVVVVIVGAGASPEGVGPYGVTAYVDSVNPGGAPKL